ncbi:MAG: tRNA (adenine-N1)-methyltransferase [Acidimicrobiales bacterium]|jgi:tRNA (adenine57-N1/adenine58-N1)-methyltransferase|nr:tRNA (adenine-N1)-methyltransferase [Acidimicrobiales bacterium]
MSGRGPLHAGEPVLLIDRKRRRYLVDLAEGGEFHTHSGVLSHDELIGSEEGALFRSTKGMVFTVLRPTITDFVLKMPRGAQVIYPKDIGPILILADIFSGARVLESGLGSGALSTGMLRAGAEISGYEIREDFEEKARENVSRFLGDEVMDRYRTQVRDVYEGIDETDLDRVVLDLPEPWQVVPHAEKALRPGGIFVAYSPSIMQVSQLHEAFEESHFGFAETTEVLNRGWHVQGAAVRPDHRMVAHTGFLTHARLLEE